jgi:hypothetical protein
VALSVGASGHAGAFGVGAGGSGTAGTGGTPPLAGTGGITIDPGETGGTGAEAAAGGVGDNPYPPVTWQSGQGYRDVCPEHGDTSGFTCWHESAGTGTTCAIDGSPSCNACSCAIPCDEPLDCPSGQFGEPASCFGSDSNVSSCFLTCDDGACPAGMTCSTYPGSAARLCMWVDPSVGMSTPK